MEVSNSLSTEEILNIVLTKLALMTMLLADDGKILTINISKGKSFDYLKHFHREVPYSSLVKQLHLPHFNTIKESLRTSEKFSTSRFDFNKYLQQLEWQISKHKVADSVYYLLELKQQDLHMANKHTDDTNLAKSEFLAGMSHDLRTPLSSILGITETLLASDLDSEKMKMTTDIAQGGKQLLQMIEDILNYTKIESGLYDVNYEEFNLKDLLHQITNLLNPEALKKNISITVSYPENIPETVCGDISLIRRILMNLIGNALKFTHEGYILISVVAIEITASTAKLQFAVEDTGIGIPANKLDYIFEKFNRLHCPRQSAYKGNGLGLAIVKQLIEQLGGKIHVNSQISKGTTFWFSLPLLINKSKIDNYPWMASYKEVPILFIRNTQYRCMQIAQFDTENNAFCTYDEFEKILVEHSTLNTMFQVIIVDYTLADKIHEIRSALSSLSCYRHVMFIALDKGHSDANPEGFDSTIDRELDLLDFQTKLSQSWENHNKATLESLSEDTNFAPKILLVEDDFLAQRVTGIILSAFGCNVETASTGQEALEKSTPLYDLILMDIGLPDTDGIEVTKKIRKTYTREQLPIIALTAHVRDSRYEKCLAAGMDGVLRKPATKEELALAISRFMRQ